MAGKKAVPSAASNKSVSTKYNRNYFPTFTVQIYRHMANHKATKKDMRQASKRRERNRYYGKTTRNAIRDFKALTDKTAAGEKAPQIASMLDRLAKRGVIHKNKASNLKSKLARKLNTVSQ